MMRVLVIDATHGGLTLSDEFAKRGNEVVCADIYKTIKRETEEIFRKNFGLVKVLPDVKNYDLIVSPVHFPLEPLKKARGTVITHHQAVRSLIKGLINYPVVEITGSFGKTSAIWATISILKRFSILTLTSDGIYHIKNGERTQLTGKISTTPANIIKAVRLCPEKVDLAIFEVSLGGTGLADLGVIKNVYDNYAIAGGTSSAYEAKLSMIRDKLPDASVLVNADDPLLRSLKGVQTFSTQVMESEVKAKNIITNAKGLEFEVKFENFKCLHGFLDSKDYKIHSGPKLIGRQHVENLLLASAIAAFFGATEEDIQALKDFEGADKKMIFDNSQWQERVLNVSSSIGPKTLENSIMDFIEAFSSSVPLCIGGKLKTTCGGVNLIEVVAIINRMREINPVALFGEFGESIRPLLIGKELTDLNSLGKGPILYLERG